MRANPRSGAVSLPTEVAFSTIWAWLGDESPRGSPKELSKGSYLEETDTFSTYTRDVPYGYDSLLENFVDVSHIPFAHHGMQGSRDDARPISMTVPKVHDDAASEGGVMSFSFEDHTMGRDRKSKFNLLSPFLFVYNGEFEHKEGESGDKRKFRLSICCVPVSPGYSRMIILNPRSRDGAAAVLFRILPRWAVHLLSNRFIDSDLAFIHYQERNLRRGQGGAEGWNTGYYMPGESDRSIGTWRRWLSSEGARCVLPGPGSELPPTPSRSELLDRYKQHTRHCVHCQEGLRTLDAWQLGAGGLGLAALVADRCFDIGPAPLLLAGQVLAVLAVVGINRLRQEFYFVDYEHYKT